MKDLKVKQLENKNQFVIERIKNNCIDYTFQSYETIICKIDNNKNKIVFDKYIYNGSRTTMKHLYIFLNKYYQGCNYTFNKKFLFEFIKNENILVKNLN